MILQVLSCAATASCPDPAMSGAKCSSWRKKIVLVRRIRRVRGRKRREAEPQTRRSFDAARAVSGLLQPVEAFLLLPVNPLRARELRQSAAGCLDHSAVPTKQRFAELDGEGKDPGSSVERVITKTSFWEWKTGDRAQKLAHERRPFCSVSHVVARELRS